MNVNPFKIHADSIASFQATMGTECPLVTILGKDVSVIPGTAMLRKDLSPGGFQMNADFVFTVLVASFGPGSNAVDIKNKTLQRQISYLGDAYKVASVSILAGGFQLHFEANSINQNA